MTVLWAFRLLSRIWLLILAFAKVGAASLPLSNEVPYHRDYLYVGGHYADDGSGKGQHIFKDQMYVERLVPMNGTTKPFPIVFIHGQANTGTVSTSHIFGFERNPFLGSNSCLERLIIMC